VALAWITSCTDAPLARRFENLPTLTLALSPLVGAIGWLVLLSPRVGVLNLAVRSVLGLDLDSGPFNAFSLPVIVMLMTFYVVPYVYGPVHAAFRQIDASLIEAARACGSRPATTLWTVTLPLLKPAILAGSLIGGVMVASMFAIPLILSAGTGLHVIPTQIYHSINQEGRPGPAMAMASLLTVVTVTAMALYFKVLGSGRFVTLSGKGSRPVRVSLGLWRWPASALVLGFLFLSTVLPVLTLAYLSLVGFWSGNLFSQPLSLNQYTRLADFPGTVDGLINSTWMAASAATLALLAGFLISYQRLWRSDSFSRGAAFLGGLPLGVPSIVLGLAFLYTFTGGPLPLYGTALILVLCYAVHVLPIAMRSSDAGLMRVAPELEEAARACGDTRLGAVWRVILPSIRQPLLVAWGLAFIILFRDVSISILMYTAKTTPSSVALLGLFDQGMMTGAAAYSIVMTLISVAVVLLIIRASRPVEAAG
jgi:iron(III) transport system permease protein